MADDVEVQEKPVTTAAPVADGAGKGAAPAADASAGKPAEAAPVAADPAAKTAAKGAGKPAAGKATAAAPAADAKPAGKAPAAPASDFLYDDGDDVDDDEGAEPEDTDKSDKASIPDQWRELFAGGDEKALARLKRFGGPQGVIKSLLAAEHKIRSGEYKKIPGADATDEEKAAWRKELGVPDKPDGYKVPDVEGHKWLDEDKPIINTFLQQLHGADASQAVIDKMLSTYATITTAQKEAVANKDRSDLVAIRDHMRDQHGPEFRSIDRLMNRALNDPELMPDGLGDLLKSARGPDGTKLIATPAMANWLAQLALDNYGAGAMVTGDGETTISSREEELVNMRQSNIDKYQNGRNAKGQSFAEELLEIRQKKAASGGRMRRA